MPVLLPESLHEACGMLAERHAIPVAGGTDLLVHWPSRVEAHEATYLDLSAIQDLRSIRWSESELVLGALTTYWDIVRDTRAATEFPLLVAAARQIGAVQIQTRGTWAGNIVNGSPAADGVPVMMAYDAVIVLESSRGREEVPLHEFYLGYKKMRRTPDQLVTEIRIPRRKFGFERFEKVGARKAQVITKVGIAVTHSDVGWRVVANSVAPTVRRCPAVEELLEARTPIGSPDGLLAALARDVSPIDDLRSTAEYRQRVLARLLYFTLRERQGWPA